MGSLLNLISLMVLAARLAYAGSQWFRKIVADAFSKPGDDVEVDVPPRPLRRDDDRYTGD